MSGIRIVLVDDHVIVARALKAYLESFAGFVVVGIATSGERLLAQLPEWRPHVVIQDLLIPGGLDGIETTRLALTASPGLRIVALTASLDEARLVGVLRAGALGYVRKDSDPEVLLDAVRAAMRGLRFIDPAAAVRPAFHTALTQRERDVLQHLAHGRSNRDIAGALGIGEETVKTHVAHLLAKLDVDNRAQAVAVALKMGISE